MDATNGVSPASPGEASQSGAVSQGQGAPSQANAPAEERIFKQSEVNDIVKRAKHDAVDSFKRMQVEQPQYAQQKYGEAGELPRQPQQVNEVDYRKIAAEEAQRLRDEWVRDARQKAETQEAERIVSKFMNNIASGREKYQDFDNVTSDIDLVNFPNVVQLLAEHVDNPQDVYYELGKDRMKLSGLELSARLSHKDAIKQVKALADSLRLNETASNAKLPNEPLNQLRPSNTGTGTNSALTVSDYRRKYRV